MLIQGEADQQRHRIVRDQRVGLVGVGEIELGWHGPLVIGSQLYRARKRPRDSPTRAQAAPAILGRRRLYFVRAPSDTRAV